MKILISSIVGLLGSIGVVVLDLKLLRYIFTLIPQSDWSGLIKIVIIFFDIWFTLGICILPFALGFFIGATLESK